MGAITVICSNGRRTDYQVGPRDPDPLMDFFAERQERLEASGGVYASREQRQKRARKNRGSGVR
jgi:hypothetical protein